VDEDYVRRTRAIGFATAREALRVAYAHEAARRKERLSEPSGDKPLIERETPASSPAAPGDNPEM
jgi:hypothetical protein